MQSHYRLCEHGGFHNININSIFFTVSKVTALSRRVINYVFVPREKTDALNTVLDEFKIIATLYLESHMIDVPFKLAVSLKATFYMLGEPSETIQPYFNMRSERSLTLIMTMHDVHKTLNAEVSAVVGWVEMYNARASNWILKSVDQLELACHKANVVGGAGHSVKLPPRIACSHSVINIQNTPTNECFKIAMSACIHH